MPASTGLSGDRARQWQTTSEYRNFRHRMGELRKRPRHSLLCVCGELSIPTSRSVPRRWCDPLGVTFDSASPTAAKCGRGAPIAGQRMQMLVAIASLS